MASNKTGKTKLDALVEDIVQVIENLDNSITLIDANISALEDDQAGVQHVQSMMTTAASAFIINKTAELAAQYGGAVYPTGEWRHILSGSFGTNNLTEWVIVSGASKVGQQQWRYFSPDNVTSGAPSAALTQQYNRQIDFQTSRTHLNKTSSLTGTYGIDAKISSLQTAKGLQESNRAAFQSFLKAYDRHRVL